MELTPVLAGIIVFAIILVMFAAAAAVVLINRSNAKKKSNTSLPQGGDISEFSRSMSRRFESEDRL